MDIVSGLLRKNTSVSRIAGFVLSNFIGIAIVIGALQFYCDAGSIWTEEGSFVSTDYMVLNKKVTSANMWGDNGSSFTEEEIADIKSQPWVRNVGRFTASDYKVLASVAQGGKGFSTYMFFESIPGEFVDVDKKAWTFDPSSGSVPIIISKDYLALYNFGFAGTAGLPQMSENLMSGIPLRLTLTSDDGTRRLEYEGHVAGYSNRLNTILVPEEFMDMTNSRLGKSGGQTTPSRLIVDVSSPGDVAIAPYLEEHGLEAAGDKSGSSASFLLRLVVGIVIAVGGVITLLSFFILMLSISLIMEKNRDKLHSLLMLGYDLSAVSAPYRRLVVVASLSAGVLALCVTFLLRGWYLGAVTGLGATPGFPWEAPVCALVLTVLIIVFNVIAVERKVRNSWRVER